MSATFLNHRYRILQALSEGGFGTTFVAEDTQMPSRRQCVIKQLKPMSNRPGVFAVVQQRFDREAAVLEAVGKGHSQIPDLYAYFSEGGQFYLVQEWIEGQPLSAMARSTWTEERVSKLLVNALSALAHVHSQNIIHRDIKPDNIILRKADQLPCLIDFGAVKELMSTVASNSRWQQSSITIGTPGFMPPEQAAGRPTFASDIYSLAITMICLLTGRSPTEIPSDSSQGHLLWQQYVPKLSDRLTRILTRATHPSAQNRYPTATDMLAALKPQSAAPRSASTPYSKKTTFSITMSDGQTVLIRDIFANAFPSNGAAKQSRPKNTSSKPPAASPKTASGKSVWKRVGLTAGAVTIAAGVFLTMRPPAFVQNRLSNGQSNHFASTITALKKTIKSDQNDANAQLKLADAYRETGDYDSAMSQLSELLTQNPNNSAALLGQGKVQFAQGDYTAAATTLTQSINADGRHVEAFNVRGDAYFETGQYEKALADYRSALKIDPDNAQSYMNLSQVNFVQGNLAEAMPNIDLAIQKDPSLMSAYMVRGSQRDKQELRIDSYDDWRKASNLPATTAKEYTNRGTAQAQSGSSIMAMDNYNQALKINPNYVPAYVGRASVIYEHGVEGYDSGPGDPAQALRELDKALAINSKDASALSFKGKILAFQANPEWQAVIDLYSQALSVNPNDPEVLNDRCRAYLALKKWELALSDCSKGIEINAQIASLHAARSTVYLHQQDYSSSMQDLNRTIEISDQMGIARDLHMQAAAHSDRADIFLRLNDLDKAAADLKNAIQWRGGNPVPEDHFRLGWIYIQQGDRFSGVSEMQQAVDLYVKQGRTYDDNYKSALATIKELGL